MIFKRLFLSFCLILLTASHVGAWPPLPPSWSYLTGKPIGDGYIRQTSGTLSSQAPNSAWVYATGTVATITNSNGALTFGTTSPATTLTAAGTYILGGYVNIITASSTFAANQNIACQFYRTNNTPGAVANSTVYTQIPIMTTLTIRLPGIVFPPIYYTTANTNDAIAVYCVLSASAGAGSVTSDNAAISYLGLFQ